MDLDGLVAAAAAAVVPYSVFSTMPRSVGRPFFLFLFFQQLINLNLTGSEGRYIYRMHATAAYLERLDDDPLSLWYRTEVKEVSLVVLERGETENS